MPPPLSQRSDENSSEDEVSDSGSIEAAPESDSLQKLRESAMDVLESRLTSHYGETAGKHVTGKLINNAKRGPADDFANNHVAKYPKLDQEEDDEDEQSDEEEEYSSSEEDEEDEEEEDDDEEGQASGSYPNHSASGRFVVSEGVPPWAPHHHPSADKLPLHPDLVGMTPVDLFQHALPHVQLPHHLAPIARHLAERPIRRMPILGKPFADNKPDNFSAYFLQATGHLVPDEQACTRCRGVIKKKRLVGGAFVGCVVSADPEEAKLTGGACANCWYGRQGSLCSFRNPEGRPKGRPKGLYEPRSQISNTSLMLEGQPMEHGQQLGNTGQVHPAFLASVSSASPAYTPFSDYSKTDAQVVHQRNGEPPILSRPDGSLSVSKLTGWETEYTNMSTDELMATHGSLVAWQEDLNTRLLAMNKVLLDRLGQRE